MRNALLITGIGAIILAGGWWFLAHEDKAIDTEIEKESVEDYVPAPEQTQGAAIGGENLVEFRCDGGKTLTAVFERDIVGLTLSDGRQVVLRQTPSASGIRYLSNDTKIEFAAKGEGGFLEENGATTYANCVALN